MTDNRRRFLGSKGLPVGLVLVLLFLAAAPVGGAAQPAREAQAGMSDAWRLPFVRMGHSAVMDDWNDRMVVFGGWNGQQFFNDVWSLDLNPDNYAWTRLSPEGAWPPPRGMHTAIYDRANKRMIVFGGRGFHYNFDDVWALDLATPGAETWTLLQPSGPAIPARRWHTAIYDRAGGRMVVFGGSGTGLFNDVWALDLTPGAEAWSQVPVTGSVPAARWQHTAFNTSNSGSLDAGRMIVFGGATGGGTLLNDTWELDLATMHWTQLALGATRPPARRGHTAVANFANGNMLLFGGLGENGFLGDTWQLEVEPGAMGWQQMAINGGPPAARAWHAAIADPTPVFMYLTGGRGMDSLAGEAQWGLNVGGWDWDALQPTLPEWWAGGAAAEQRQATGRPEVTLQIEDAAPNQTVNLLSDAELEVWFVCKISTSSATYKNDIDVTITLPTARFIASTVRAGTRTGDVSPPGTWLTPDNLGGGQYRLNDVDLPAASSGGYSLQVVFKASPVGNSRGSSSITARARGTNWQSALESSATARFYPDPQSWIVVNRKLLFDRYLDGDVLSLLRELYELELGRTAVVLYADRSVPALQTWNNAAVSYASETAANQVADDLAGWLVDRVVSWSPVPLFAYPDYLLLVGDDNVIPFYRQWDESIIPENGAPGTYNGDAVVTALVSHNYYFTDNPYGDQQYGTVRQDWETGDLEAAVGRIVGASAADMMAMVNNGGLGPVAASGRSIVASGDGWDWWLPGTDVVSVVKDQLGYTVDTAQIDGNPTKTAVTREMDKGFAALVLGGHGTELGWIASGGAGPDWPDNPGPDGIEAGEMDLYDHAGDVSGNRPFYYFGTCRTGLSHTTAGAYDSMVYALAHHQASGGVASAGLACCVSANDVALHAEALGAKYWSLAGLDGTRTDPLGWALKEAKRQYVPPDAAWDATDEKTVQEFTYFGLPWMRLPASPTLAGRAAAAANAGWSAPRLAAPQATYVMSTTVDASTYALTQTTEGFDLIQVAGLDQAAAVGQPVLPMAHLDLILPLSATVSGLVLTPTLPVVLDNLDIPSLALETGATAVTATYTTTTGGPYPAAAGYQARLLDLYQVVQVSVQPAAYDAAAGQATLYQRVDVAVEYDTPQTLALSSFEPDQSQFLPGETIGAGARLVNAGAETETVTATLVLQNFQGEVIAFQGSGGLDVPAGGSYDLHLDLTGPLDGDTYALRLLVWHDGQVVAGAGRPVVLTAGQLTDLTVPRDLAVGQDAPLSVTLHNLGAGTGLATVSLAVYDAAGAPVGFPEPQAVALAGGGSATLTFHWTPAVPGSYLVSAVALAGSQEYGPLTASLEVTTFRLYLPLLKRASP